MNITIGVRGYAMYFAFPHGHYLPVSTIPRVLYFMGRNALTVLALFASLAIPVLGAELPATADSFVGIERGESEKIILASNSWADNVGQALSDVGGNSSIPGDAECNWDLDLDSSRFYKTPWLIYQGNPTEMHIYFETITGVSNLDSYRQVHFEESGVSNGVSMEKVVVDDGPDSNLFNTLVTGLTPGQSYTYTVKVRDVVQDEYFDPAPWDCFKGTFFAAAGDDFDTLEFYGFGDQKYIDSSSSGNIGYIMAVLDAINTHWAPNNFIINTGDMVLNGGNHRPFSVSGKGGTSYWDEYWWIEHNGFFLGSMPMFTAMGNHDFQVNKGDTNCMFYANCDDSVVTNDSGKSNPDNYYRYFHYPHAPDGEAKDAYYHFRYGPAHFWSLDTWPTNNDDSYGYCGSSDNLSPGSSQYKWFVQTIEALEDDPTQQWKIVFMHNPPYSPGDCNQPEIQQYWVPLFEKYGVDLVLSGHEHYYSRKIVNDIPYMLLGGGGAGLSDYSHPERVDVVFKHHHFAYFSIDHDVLKIGVHDTDQTLIDTLTVDRTPDAGWSAQLQSYVKPLEVQFTDESTGNIYLWEWDFGDGATLSGSTEGVRSPTHVYEDYGNYTATLTVRSKNNVSTHTGNVEISPAANFTATPAEEPAAPLQVQFTDMSEGEVSEYLWYFGDSSTSSERDPLHTYNANGKYSVKLTVTTNGASDAVTASNFIKVQPYAEFQSPDNCDCVGGEVVCAVSFENLSQGVGLTYQWDFGDGGTSTVPSPTWYYACGQVERLVKLIITDTNGLSDMDSKYVMISD